MPLTCDDTSASMLPESARINTIPPSDWTEDDVPSITPLFVPPEAAWPTPTILIFAPVPLTADVSMPTPKRPAERASRTSPRILMAPPATLWTVEPPAMRTPKSCGVDEAPVPSSGPRPVIVIPPPPEVRPTPLRTVEPVLMRTPPFMPSPTTVFATLLKAAVVNVPSSVTDPVPPEATKEFSRSTTPPLAPPAAFPATPWIRMLPLLVVTTCELKPNPGSEPNSTPWLA